MQFCISCGKNLKAGSTFCTNCGVQQSTPPPTVQNSTYFCERCGNKLASGNAFCANCGARLNFGGTSLPLYSQKNKKKHLLPLIVVAAVLIAVVVIFVYINGATHRSLVGTWERTSGNPSIYVFNRDGSGIAVYTCHSARPRYICFLVPLCASTCDDGCFVEFPLNWRISRNRLIIDKDVGMKRTIRVDFEIQGDVLVLDRHITWHRVR